MVHRVKEYVILITEVVNTTNKKVLQNKTGG